jgi:hypothetical protein
MAALQSPRFAGIDVLQACLDGLHRMMEPETGIAVQRVQQALVDLGYPIPSGATGNFLHQTGAAVVAFKRDHSLVPDDPVVGPGTMSALDRDIVDFDASHPSSSPGDPPAGSHCWVAPGTDVERDGRPGLLVEWRSAAAGWEGRVVYLSQRGKEDWTVVETWVPADRVTPA